MPNVTWAMMQCWDCGHVQTLARIRPCERCAGPVEVLQTRDGTGPVRCWNLEEREYRRRGVNILKRLGQPAQKQAARGTIG